jgi:hypothetical protein
MIKDKHKLEEFERKLLETENLPYEKALAIYEALFKEAVSLGVINTDNILEGIEVDIKMARILNQLK